LPRKLPLGLDTAPKRLRPSWAVQGTKDQALPGAFSVHVWSLADVQVDVGDHLEELLIRPGAEGRAF